MYNDNKVKPSNLMLPKINTYLKSYDWQTKLTYFLIDDDDLLKKYNTIGIQFGANVEKQFDSKHVCDKDFLKTKIKFHGDEATDFCDFNHTCLAVISLDAVLKKDYNYNQQVFFENVNTLRKCN